jgi:hypothetical protein
MAMSRERSVRVLGAACLLAVVPVSVSFALLAGQAAAPAVSGYTSVTDPLEHAFTVSVPAGWQSQAGMARRAALQIDPYVRSLSPDKMTYLLIGDPTLVSFVPPSPMRNTIGLTEGKLFNGGLGGVTMVLRYLPGTEFARLYGQTALGGLCPGLQLAGTQNRPDLAQKAESEWPTPVPSREDGGEARFTCTHHGQKMEAVVDAATRIDNTGVTWNVILLDGMIAPAASASAAASTLEHVFDSIQFSPAWMQMQERLDAQAAAAINANMQQYFRQERSFMTQLNAEDTAFDSMDAIINGYGNYRDPQTGQTYSLGSGESWFIDESTGRIVGSPNGTAPEWGGYVPLQRAP